MTIKPVKFLSDVQTQKQFIKTDVSGNIIFSVSGTVGSGSVSSSLPYLGSTFSGSNTSYFTNLVISGSDLPFVNVAGPQINVGSTLSAIDTKMSQMNISQVIIGTFEADGTKNIQLIDYQYSDLEYLAYHVLIKESGSQVYTNDLISVQVSGNQQDNTVHLLLRADALSSQDTYKIILDRHSGSIV